MAAGGVDVLVDEAIPVSPAESPTYTLYGVIEFITTANVPRGPPTLTGELVAYTEDDITYLDPFLGPQTGRLYISNYKMYFQATPVGGESEKACILSIPLGMISHLEKKRLSWFCSCWEENAYCLEISCKDLRILRFAHKEEMHIMYDRLQHLAFPTSDSKSVFAYGFKEDYPENGWEVYDAAAELARMTRSGDAYGVDTQSSSDGYGTCPVLCLQGIDSENVPWRITTANQDFALCATYPRVLGVPSSCSDEDIRAVAQFRSSNRLPVLSWLHPVTLASITRSSQPKVGLTRKRSKEDEAYLEAIREANKGSKKLFIMDARPWINALGNLMKGKGYEHDDVYVNTEITFLDIENIHAMRKSLRVLQDICRIHIEDKQWFSKLEATHWLDYIKAVLEGALRVVEVIERQRSSVLVHCSDGWDRTSQLTALAMLMLDPYFRTITGFEILLEKEWISFGHMFSKRIGHGDRNYGDDQRSPIFLQFVDCVWQMTVQFPKAFEFNEHFLVTILDHLYSCLFGTFLGNSEKTRTDMRVKESTKSLWSYINSQIEDYKNPHYSEPKHREVLFPSVSIRKLQLWSGYYLRWNPRMKPQVTGEEQL